MSQKNGISYIGAVVVTAKLLERSKAGQEGDESFAAKVCKNSFSSRVSLVRDALNYNGGPSVNAAKVIKQTYFSDVEEATLVEWLTEAVTAVKGTTTIALPSGFEGNLQFDPPTENTWCEDEDEDASYEDDECDSDDADETEADDAETP